MGNNLNFIQGFNKTTRGRIDVKYRVANETEQNALITNDLIEVGDIIWLQSANEGKGKHLFLETYPNFGSLVDVIWKPVGNEKTGDITTNDSEKVPDSTVTYQLKQLIDNLTFLDKDVPPFLVDAQSEDGINDTIRFTFKGGSTVDLNAELFVNLDTFKQAVKKSGINFIIQFTNVDGSVDELDVTSWFDLMFTNQQNISTNEQDISDNGIDIQTNKTAISNVQIADENNITQHSVDLLAGEKLKFKGFQFNSAEETLSPILSFEIDTFFIDDVNGNDTTGTMGFSSLPFASIDEALANTPVFDGNGNRLFTYKILNANTYEVLTTFPERYNYRIISDYNCTISFENNTNANIAPNAYNNTVFQIIAPNAILKFSNTVSQYFQRSKNVIIKLKELHYTPPTNSNLFASAGEGFDIDINNVFLNGSIGSFHNVKEISRLSNVNISTLKVMGNDCNIISTSSTSDIITNLNIKKITGSGKVYLVQNNTHLNLGNIDINGDIFLVDGLKNCSVHFNNSLILGNSFKWSGWALEDFTMSGIIDDNSNVLLNDLLAGYNVNLTFNNFKGKINNTKFYQSATINIIDSHLTFENIPFELRPGNTRTNYVNVNVYGNSSIQSVNPTIFGTKQFSTGTPLDKYIINDYGNLVTNILKLGNDTLYEKKLHSLGSYNSLDYIEVNASRNLASSDNGKCLVITATNINLTIPTTGLQDAFNCTITPTTGNNATIVLDSGVTADENGLTVAAQEMKSIGKLGSTYIIRP